jgi:hypothetical protein
VFRGQRDASWFLLSSLERACARLRPDVTIEQAERHVLRKFQERAAEYYQSCPDNDDALGWFSLIQHHGGPTRLLDFSKSVHVAAFFALAEADGESAIWAVNSHMTVISQNRKWMALNPERLQDQHLIVTIPSFNELYHGRAVWNDYGAGITGPEDRKGRIGYQNGFFLFPLNMRRSLEENLYGMHGIAAERVREHVTRGFYDGLDHAHTIETLQQSRVVKFTLHRSMRREGLRALRKMGCDYTGLFRDLDGFARAMGHEVYDLTTDPT